MEVEPPAASAAPPLDTPHQPAADSGAPSPTPPADSPAGASAPTATLDLPRGSVRKAVKAALTSAAPGGGDVAVSKEALAALGECAKIFLHYITSTAADAAKEGKRQTVLPADVVAALGDTGFEELVERAAAAATAAVHRAATPTPAAAGAAAATEEAGPASDAGPPAQKRRLAGEEEEEEEEEREAGAAP